LFRNTPPSGFLLTLGSLLIGLTFAVGGLIRSVLLRIVLSTVSIFVAIAGTWLLHVNLADSSLQLTPLFMYAYTWPLAQVLLTALGVSFLIGTFGNLVSLYVRDEY
jgi:hypothetical protein